MRFISLVGILALSACANFSTISRSTTTKINPNKNNGYAKAIHLDAEQRIVMVHPNGIYCAEPSPDLGSATSGSFGASAGVPGTGAGSLSAAQAESIAALSKRTQSTQIQREVMYRICEAYYNGTLTGLQTAVAISRAQDLTTVILAVEQLTGVVAADQFAITGSASATASASLVSNQANLETAKKFEEEAKERFDAANKAVEDKDAEVTAAREKFEKTTGALTAAENAVPPVQEDINNLTAQKNADDLAVKRLEADLEDLRKTAKSERESYDRAKEITAAIEKELDSALANSSASAGGNARFSSSSQARELNLEATKYVTKAVDSIVSRALDKNYLVETCLGIIGQPIDPQPQADPAQEDPEAFRYRAPQGFIEEDEEPQPDPVDDQGYFVDPSAARNFDGRFKGGDQAQFIPVVTAAQQRRIEQVTSREFCLKFLTVAGAADVQGLVEDFIGDQLN